MSAPGVRSFRVIPWVLFAFTMGLLAVNVTLGTLNGSLQTDLFFVIIAVPLVAGYGGVGALVASRRAENPIGWLFLMIAIAFMLAVFGEEAGTYLLSRDPGTTAAGYVAWVSAWVWPVTALGIAMVLLLFPTGKVPGRRWRFLVPVMTFMGVAAMIGLAVQPGQIGVNDRVTVENPLGVPAFEPLAGPVLLIAAIVLLVGAVLCASSLVFRFRRARAEERQQIRWLAYVALAAIVFFIGGIATGIPLGPDETSVANEAFFTMLFLTLAIGIPVAAGVAVLRYRLYQLDIVVKRALVLAVLAAFVSIVYVAVVIGLGAVVVGDRASGALSFAAAAIIAIAFQPVRAWGRRLADRVVYGRRATPYEVLTEFSERAAETYSLDDVLPTMAQLLGEGTGAARADVWLRVGGGLRQAASWPADATPVASVPVSGNELPDLPSCDRAVPVVHQGELLGALAVRMPPEEPATPAHEKLIADLAAQAGLVLRNVRLIEELRASRQRLVRAQDEERRRLERNIHDGAQQQLVALAVKLRLASQLLDRDPPTARGMLDQLQREANQALEELRDLARGIYPPVLADQGLPAALTAQGRRFPFDVRVDPNGVGRYSEDVEAAVYFCTLEALQNASKYAEASGVSIRLSADDGSLRFEIEDDGRGFDPSTTPAGSGLTNIRDRLAALGGTVEIRSQPGEGTTITGRVPIVTG